MTLITFLAVAPLIVVITLLAAAVFMSEPGPAFVAVILIILYFVAVSFFNEGARWQHNYTLENYTLIQKP